MSLVRKQRQTPATPCPFIRSPFESITGPLVCLSSRPPPRSSQSLVPLSCARLSLPFFKTNYSALELLRCPFFPISTYLLFATLLARAGKTNTQSPLEFADQLGVGDGLPTFVLPDHLWLLVDLLFRFGTNQRWGGEATKTKKQGKKRDKRVKKKREAYIRERKKLGNMGEHNSPTGGRRENLGESVGGWGSRISCAPATLR